MSFPEGGFPEGRLPDEEAFPEDDDVVEGELVEDETDEERATQRGDAAVNEVPNRDGGAPGSTLAEETEEAEEPGQRDDLVRERDEYLRALQRTQADFENYRKRIARQQSEQSARAAADLVSKLLPVLDTLDLAEAHLSESLEASEDGKALRAARSMLVDTLSREGLERVDQAEVPFDPQEHDAVAQSPGDPGGNGVTMVEEVLRPGYRWKGQELRAAMVRVRG